MTIFFFVVGLEIKRELVIGELATLQRAALPAAAALGGMVGPALIYLAFNAGGDGARGWGIPMATDIAFAVGVVSVLGSRISAGLRTFLLALAIVDDIGAIAVIAVFYGGDILANWLLVAFGLVALTAAADRVGVRDLKVYVALGIAMWLALHESGVHATIAGVAMALLTPARARYERKDLEAAMESLLAEYRSVDNDQSVSDYALQDIEEVVRENRSVLQRLEHGLHPWSSYVIVPMFALANAGVVISAGSLADAVGSPITLGVALGLVLGNPVGIMVGSYVAVRLGFGELPAGARWRDILSLACVAGIGFTVALLIAELAFVDAQMIEEAKIGILAGSATMGIGGYLLLRLLARGAAEMP
jgi:NhaA family Na+:H+ antiporter